MPLVAIADPAEAAAVFAGALPVLEGDDGSYRPGEPDIEGAALALASLTKATALAAAGEASGIVTGPVSKARLAEVGFVFPGQTEFVADACGIAATGCGNDAGGAELSATVPLTVHCALVEVPALLTAELIAARCRIVAKGLQEDFGIASPRLAVAALNPHAGEGGKFGDEEQRVIAPAIEALRAEGIDATGPHPADALFAAHERNRYDVAICMYHDQALIPLESARFRFRA